MTYRLPTLNSLRAFEAAARHLSFKTAAVELGVTAGAVSQQVKKLEASLGVDLFARLPHGLLLTHEGEIYLPQISKVFEDLTEATEAIAPKINSKKFRVGLSRQVQALLPERWPEPDSNLNFHIRETITTSDVQMIHTNEIDCLIRHSGGPYGRLSMTSVPVPTGAKQGGGEIHVVCKPGLRDCRQSKAILEDLWKRVEISSQ